MNNVELKDLVGGELQEKFSHAFENVVKNLQDPNTPFKVKRCITIKLTFDQNELRDDATCTVDVTEKLAPQAGLKTSFSIGKDLRTGEVYAEEYGKQIKGQMTFNDLEPAKPKVEVDGKTVDTETGEIIGESTVVDFRSKKAQ